MANRFENEFPRSCQHHRLPPLGPGDIARYVDRGRQLRAEAMQRSLRRLASAVARAVRAAVAGLVRRPGPGRAKRAAAGPVWPPMDKNS